MFIVAVMGLIFNLIQIKILHGGDTHFHLGEGFHGHAHGEEGEDHGHSHGNHGHAHAGAIDNKELAEPLNGGDNEHGHAHSHGHSHGEKNEGAKAGGMNLDAATLHVMGDMLMSVGVIIASIFIYIWPSLWMADPLCTYLFSIIVTVTTLPIVKKCLTVMMEGTPDEVNLEDLEKDILEADE
jgi:zinc transporter 2